MHYATSGGMASTSSGTGPKLLRHARLLHLHVDTSTRPASFLFTALCPLAKLRPRHAPRSCELRGRSCQRPI